MSISPRSIQGQLLTKVVNAAAGGAGDVTLIAAAAGKQFRIYRVVLGTTAASTIGFKSGASTALSGLLPVANNSIFKDDSDSVELFTTATGEAFVLAVGAATDVDGYIHYVEYTPGGYN